MPAEYVIASLGQKIVWEDETAKGDFPVGLQGDDREVLIFHDASTKYAAPKVGDKLFGDVTKDGRGNWRFKRAARADSPGSGGPRQQAKRDQGPGLRWHNAPYNSSASHPRDEVRMIRTSALSSAPAYIESMFTFAPLEGVERPKTAAEYWVLVNRVVERLEASYHSALGAYDERVSPQPQLAAEVPADTDGLAEEQRAHDASIPF